MPSIISCGRHKFDLKSVTVEPVMFLYMFCIFLQFITFQALVYDKVCKEKFNDTICNHLENETFKAEENEVQKTTSTWLLYNNLAMGLPSLVTVVLFLGPWGDMVGRKIPVVSPLIGAILVGLGNIINSCIMDAPLQYLLIGNFLNGLFGGYIAALMSMYSYIAAVSSPKYRTFKIGVLEAMIFLSGTVGTATSGVMLDRTSYTFVFSLITALMVLSLVYTLVWIDNVKPGNENEDRGREVLSCVSLMIVSIKDVCLCVYEKRKNKHFLHLALMVVIIFCLMLVTVGENDIILIFTRHHPFEWSQTTLGLYKGAETFLRGIAVLTLLPLFKHKVQMRDTTLMILGLVSKTAALLVLGVGNTTLVLFIGAISGIFQGFGSAAIRSLCSSMVSANELAKLFSLIGMFESIASLAATSLFNTVYNATLNFYHGFCFLMAAAFIGACIFIAVYLHVRLLKEGSQDYSTLEDEIGTNEVVIDPNQVQTEVEE